MLLIRNSPTPQRMSLLQLKFCTSCIRTRRWVAEWVRWRSRRWRFAGGLLLAQHFRIPESTAKWKTFYGCCCYCYCYCCSRSSSATHIVYILYILPCTTTPILPPHRDRTLTHTHTRVRPSGVHCISMLLAWKLLYKMFPSHESWVRFLWAWPLQSWLISC